MDTSNSPQKAAHLLDDLESIRQLLGDENLQPPLLTEMVAGEALVAPALFERGSRYHAEAVQSVAEPVDGVMSGGFARWIAHMDARAAAH